MWILVFKALRNCTVVKYKFVTNRIMGSKELDRWYHCFDIFCNQPVSKMH